MCYIYTTEYYSAIKKNAFMKYAGKWMELETILNFFLYDPFSPGPLLMSFPDLSQCQASAVLYNPIHTFKPVQPYQVQLLAGVTALIISRSQLICALKTHCQENFTSVMLVAS